MLPDDRFFMELAQKVAELSNCQKIKVGSVLVKDHRILATGYNGSPSGEINCSDHFAQNEYTLDAHAKFSERHEIHAEMNAIIDAMSRGVNITGSTLYVTHSPCLHCAKLIRLVKIERVCYHETYDSSVFDVLKGVKIECL